jgi:hypothetical protein
MRPPATWKAVKPNIHMTNRIAHRVRNISYLHLTSCTLEAEGTKDELISA